MLANQIKRSIKRIIYHNKWDLLQLCKTVLVLKNQSNRSHQQAKKEKSHDYINSCRKSMEQNFIPVHDENSIN